MKPTTPKTDTISTTYNRCTSIGVLTLLIPLATLLGYFATGCFLLRSATTLSCLAIVFAFCIVKQRLVMPWWIIAAFAFSFAGDYVLGHWGGSFTGFVSGVGLFLLAHLGYVDYSLRMGRLPWLLFLVLAFVFGSYYIVLLRPAIGDVVTRISVIAYILVSCLSMAAAVGIGRSKHSVSTLSRVLFIIGIASLLFSDLLIAQKRFLHDGTLYALMLPTYFASQLFVTASMLRLRLQSNMSNRLVSTAVVLLIVLPLSAEETDSVSTQSLPVREHLSLAAYASVGYMTPVAGLSEELLHSHTTAFFDLRLRYQTRPEDGNLFDALYRYPVWQAGVAFGDLSHIDVYYESKHRPYRSTLGYTISPYFSIERYFFQHGRWAVGYDLFNGVSYNTHPYDSENNADNEYIGSHFSIFFAIGFSARYRLTPQWTLSAAFDFKHNSAASMVRPNLGVNSFGPTVGVTYDLVPQLMCAMTDLPSAQSISDIRHLPFKRRFYAELTTAVIPKALPDYYNVYHTADCPVYTSYNTMLSGMCRYRPHHASGIEVNYTYVPFTERLHELDVLQRHDVIDGRELRYSPHVFGIGIRHDFIYRHFAINLGVGTFLHRRQGWRAETQEGRFYQLIGLNYGLPFTRDHLFVGYTIKAYRFSKVDGMHFGLGWRFR